MRKNKNARSSSISYQDCAEWLTTLLENMELKGTKKQVIEQAKIHDKTEEMLQRILDGKMPFFKEEKFKLETVEDEIPEGMEEIDTTQEGEEA